MVSILAYQSVATSGRSLRCVLELGHDGPMEIVVREQGGDEEEHSRLVSLAARVPPDRAVRIERGPNLGFAAAHNAAIRSTQSDVVIVLKADAWLEAKFLAATLTPSTTPIGAVQGKVLRHDGPEAAGVIDSTGLVPLRSRRIIGRGQGESDGPGFDVGG
jgi:GT2 family glycosyltransferase